MKRRFTVLLLLVTPLWCAAQSGDQPANNDKPARPETQPRREGRGMRQGVAGAIAEIKPDGFTVKTMDGKTVTVKVTADTRFSKDRQPAKLADFKPGDVVMVGGEPAGTDTWTARFVGSRQGMGQGNMQALREGMGKQFIAGEVKAIDGTKLTIARVDGETQTIQVDENTSFRKGRESITLPDIKAGDKVFGRGAVNSAGVFVPTMLNVGEMRMMMMGPGEGQRGQTPPHQPPPN
ncbi:MAG: DUF5666 domain-containing protein [Acidobacteriia bacterium]|nr:DUF5666 domain-containing protein [Terriglobia bacterium]